MDYMNVRKIDFYIAFLKYILTLFSPICNDRWNLTRLENARVKEK